MIKLINPKEVYDIDYKGEATFTLRKLTTDEVNKINDAIIVSKGDSSFSYLGGTAAKMKISKALVSWKGVADALGQEVVCNEENKGLLPSEIHQFICNRIDLDNGFTKTKSDEVSEKNL